MPLLNSGIVPAAGAGGTELTVVTRRAFIPKMIVQINQASPVLAAGLANAQPASGGVSSVTVPVQGAAFVTAQMTDYSGSFNQPSSATGAFEADFNLKALVVPIPFLGFEGLLQMDAAVIPLIEARMNDAGNQAAVSLATQLATNATDQTLNIDGFPLIAAATGTYGNINRSAAASSYFRGNTMTGAGSVSPTRQLMLRLVASAQQSALGEMPNIGVLSLATWSRLAEDFVGQETYFITPGSSFDQSTQGARSAFTALMVAGVPFYADSNFADGAAYAWNTRYQSFYIHEAAAFAFTGFQSTLANFQLGYIGVLLVVLEHINVKPRTMTYQSGFLYNTL